MGAIVIRRNRPKTVLSGIVNTTENILVNENGVALEVVTLEDGDLSLVKRGVSTIINATQNKVILSDDSVSISVASSTPLDIRINDWFEVNGEIYRINQEPTLKKNNTRFFEYTIIGQGVMFDLLRVKYRNTDLTGFNTGGEFSLVGTIDIFLSVIAANMARFSTNWIVGTHTIGETKTITFSDDTCLSALQKICQEFDTEFWVKNESGQNLIHTGDFGNTVHVTLQYGKGKGLYSLERRNVNEDGIVNRLYVEGGTQNIPTDYRGFSTRLKFSTEGYLEDATAIADYGLKEGSIIFDDVYPHRTGKLTGVTALTKIRDSNIDFDINAQLLPGTTAKIHMNSGNLAGYEFEIESYDHALKELTIIPFDNGNGQIFPDANSAAFQFAANDSYVLVDILMPQTYIDNAEAELIAKGTEQFDLAKQAKVSYDLALAEDFAKKLPTPLNIGDLIRVIDADIGVDKVIRINQVTRNFIENGASNEYNQKIIIADTYEIAFASKLILDIEKVKNVISVNKLDQLRHTRRGYQVTQELKDSIFDTDGKLDPGIIRPGSIETGMLSVGAQSQAISTNLILETNVDLNPNKLKANAAVLYSQTLSKQWNLTSFTTTLPDNLLRYVYAKVSRTDTTGTILVTTAKILYEEDPSYYHILIGILSSVIDNVRTFVPTFGATTITGGMIRTGIISDQLGEFQLNLNTGTITASVLTFKAPDNSYKDLGVVYGDITTNLEELNLTRDYVDGLLQDELADLQNQLDGVVDDWYYQHSPTVANLPASDWTTLALKRDHIGDRFTNTEPFVDEVTTPDSGKQWRWIETSTEVFEWVLIPNSEAAIALNRAEQAYDLADGKRTTFIVQPFTPYQKGDLWSQGASGDIMRCNVSRASGAFVSADWGKASKYTDDTTALAIETALNTSITNSLQAAKDYSDAELNERETIIKAYADGQVTAAENRSILDATNKANAAKSYADAQDLLLRTEMQVYADGAVSAEEQARLLQAQTNLQAAKDYAIAQANAATVASNAYADGIVSDEEQARILDADNKLAQAKSYSDTQRTAAEAAMQIYTDGKVSDLELQMQGTIANSLQAAKDYAVAQDNLSLITANAYADGAVSAEEARAIADATAKMEAAKTYAAAQDTLLRTEMQVYADDAVTAEEQARLLQAQTNLQAAKDYSDAVTEAQRISTEAWADGEITAAEQRAMTDATNKANAAKAYADAQDLLMKTNIEAYADGIVSAEEAARIAAAEQAALAAQDYTNRQAELSSLSNKAYADGILDEAEKIAIKEAEKARDEAKAEAERLLGGMVIGAKQLLREYDLRFDFKYWGNVGTSEEINLNSINIIEQFVLGQLGAHSFDLVTENNEKIEIIL